jgi:hypothetical protein
MLFALLLLAGIAGGGACGGSGNNPQPSGLGY